MPKLKIFEFLKKKYSLVSETEKTKILLEVKVSCQANFLIQFPVTDNQPIIKEFYGSHWQQEIELAKPRNAYIKVFITKPIGTTLDSFAKLCLHETKGNQTQHQIFPIEEDPTIAKWLKVYWNDSSQTEQIQEYSFS